MLEKIKQTFTQIKQHTFLFITACITDIIFYYLLTKLHIETFKQAATHIKTAQKIIESQMTELTQAQTPQLNQILTGNIDFAYQYHQILKYLAVFLLGLTAIWLIIHGITWLITHKITNSKITIKEFAKKYAIFSTIGLLATTLTIIAYSAMLNHATFSPLPIINAKTANILTIILLLTIDYMMTTAFALPQNSKIRDIKISITKIKQVLPAYATSMLILATGIIMPTLIIQKNHWAGIIITLIITIPLMTIARTFMINSIKP